MLGPEERRRKLIGGQHVFSASLGRKVSDASQGGREGAWPRGKMRRSNSFEIGAQHAVGGGDDAEVMDSLKAIATLKNGLCRRFSTVYEAFVFFDMRGDWKVTANELKVMLKQIAIALPDVSQAMRFLDGASQDGAIDAKEFVHMLAWHKVHGDIAHQLELVKPRREGIVAKAIALTAAEEMLDATNPAWFSKPSETKQNQVTGAARVLKRSSTGSKSSLGTTLSLQSPRDAVKPATASPTAATSRVLSRTDSASSLQSGASGIASSDKAERGQTGAAQGGGNRAAGRRDSNISGVHRERVVRKAVEGQGVTQGQPALHSRDIRHKRLPVRQVDFSWRRPASGKQQSSAATHPVPSSPRASALHGAQDLAQQAKRKRLFQLFQRYDEDNSGTLDAEEVCKLLLDMGHEYQEAEVREALALVVPVGQIHAAIYLQDFCEWWECLNWFHELGIHEGALSMASAKYKKGAWVEDMNDMKEDVKALSVMLQAQQEDTLRTNRWYEARHPEELDPLEIQNPGTMRASHVEMATANHFFTFVQKQMAGRPKSQGSMLMNKKRSTAADLLAAANAQNKAKRKPEKYLHP